MAVRNSMVSMKITEEQYAQVTEIKYLQRIPAAAVCAFFVEYGLQSDDALRYVKQKAEEYRTDKTYNRRIYHTNFDRKENEKEDS